MRVSINPGGNGESYLEVWERGFLAFGNLYFCTMLDYLVVGLGLAGMSFCEELERHGKRFKVISDRSQTASLVAGGIYNPVVLKRLKLAWKADRQMASVLPFYRALERKLEAKFVEELPVLRRFSSKEEQNLWFEAADHPRLKAFLSTRIVANENPHIHAPYGFGKVLGTGRVATWKLLKSYHAYLSERDLLHLKTFVHDDLEVHGGHVTYGSLKAKKIVFAEGFGLRGNPFFNYLPLQGSKGEYLVIEAPELALRPILKASIFLIPEGAHRYSVGATYDWKDRTNVPTEMGKTQLQEKLDKFLKCTYKVVGQVAGIRPTVPDRRPLVGRHPNHPNLYVLNGFGSRGVMMAPFVSDQLYGYIEGTVLLDSEMDISRFTRKYFRE